MEIREEETPLCAFNMCNRHTAGISCPANNMCYAKLTFVRGLYLLLLLPVFFFFLCILGQSHVSVPTESWIDVITGQVSLLQITSSLSNVLYMPTYELSWNSGCECVFSRLCSVDILDYRLKGLCKRDAGVTCETLYNWSIALSTHSCQQRHMRNGPNAIVSGVECVDTICFAVVWLIFWSYFFFFFFNHVPWWNLEQAADVLKHGYHRAVIWFLLMN